MRRVGGSDGRKCTRAVATTATVPLDNCQRSAEFCESFIRGDKSTIYALLFWMLNRLPELKKRAYLARFLKNIDIPEENFNDESMIRPSVGFHARNVLVVV